VHHRQVGSKLLGSDAFQEKDITGHHHAKSPKHNDSSRTSNDIARTVREAFRCELRRPGPVLVDITKTRTGFRRI